MSQALKEFKRDKINRQNARLSLVNSLYENPSMPRRKILLSVGANNYRPPMERSKSAPKLMAIEEAVGEEDEICSQPSFKKSQSQPYRDTDLFTTSTFDRKYCRRNKASREMPLTRFNSQFENSKSRCTASGDIKLHAPMNIENDDDDDFNNLLMTNDYDIKSSFSGEILSYFDTKLNKSSMLNQTEIVSNPNGTEPSENLTLETHNDDTTPEFDSYNSNDSYCSLENGNVDVVDSLVEASGAKDIDIKSNLNSPNASNRSKGSPDETNAFSNSNGGNTHIVPFILDSDEGSITSGCETSSIVTTAHMDDLMKSEREIDAITLSLSRLPIKPAAPNLERVSESDQSQEHDENHQITMQNNEEDSEFSDESGFDENNIGKTKNFRNLGNKHTSTANGESTCNADTNNNIQHTFSSNTTKSVGRLRINIPKNARSIDI